MYNNKFALLCLRTVGKKYKIFAEKMLKKGLYLLKDVVN